MRRHVTKFGLAAALLVLTSCTAAELATATTDLAAVAADADKLCLEVAPLITLGDVAAVLTADPVAIAVMGAATAVRDKCVVIAPAAQELAAGNSVSSAAVALLSDPQAITDLASDVAAVKPVIKPQGGAS